MITDIHLTSHGFYSPARPQSVDPVEIGFNQVGAEPFKPKQSI
jgi:hypothetical protein